MTMSGEINVGIVGWGFASKVFHAPLIRSAPGLRLAAVSSSDPGKVTADLPDVTVHTSPDALFADPDIELVVIPTPNETHHPLAAAALAAGKHVVVDKPFTVTAEEGRDLIARAAAANRLLSVFHNRRWDGDFLTVKQALESGELGRVVHFESHFDRYRPAVRERWREDASPGGGLWYDLGSHLLDQTIHLFGTPEFWTVDLASQRDGSRVCDWFHAVLRYGEMRAVLHAAVMVPAIGPRFLVHGTRGSLITRGLDPQEDAMREGLRPGDPDWRAIGDAVELVTRGAADEEVFSTVPARSGDYLAYYTGIRDAIRNGASNPVRPEEAVEIVSMIERGARG